MDSLVTNVYFSDHDAMQVKFSNFLVWKFCGKAQSRHSFGRMARNYAETMPFHKTSTPGKNVKFRYFTQCETLG